MKLVEIDNADNFIGKVGHFLERNEAANNLMLGLLTSLSERERTGGKITDPMIAVDDDEGNLVLALLLTRFNLIVSGEGTGIERAVDTAVSYLYDSGRDVPGVIGSTAVARQFAAQWAAKKNLTSFVKMNQRIYRLDQVSPLSYASGKLRLAAAEDVKRVADWIYQFCEEINEQISHEEALTKACENIENSLLYLWQDQDSVSMAKKTRPTKNGIVLSLVYTPPQFRNRGYASSCAASLSQLLLDEGYQFCSLYTDLSNPTSNAIYSKIGYRPVQDSVMYRFR